MTHVVAAIVRGVVDTLEAAGVPSAEHDAWALLEEATGMRRAQLLSGPAAPQATLPGMDAFASLVQRRAAREPLQHITGKGK